MFLFSIDEDGGYGETERVTTTLLQIHPDGLEWEEISDTDRGALLQGVVAYNTRAYPFKRRVVVVEQPHEGMLPELLKSGKDLIEKHRLAEQERLSKKKEKRIQKEAQTLKQKQKLLEQLKSELGEK